MSARHQWLRRPLSRPNLRAVLVCCPHAGGDAGFFHPWARALPEAVELLAVQYPGRGGATPPPPRSSALHTWADEITDALRPLRGHRLALFGHSMGAVLAYEIARRLDSRRLTPERLFVSASPPPGAERPRRGDAGDAELVAALRRWGRVDPASLDQPDQRAAMLDALRGDLRVLDAYRPGPATRLGCPVTALAGADDTEVAPSAVRGWRHRTAAPFDLVTFPGDHFYLAAHRDEVVAVVADRLGVADPASAWVAP
ncbi:thioesterase II family protein [Saccharothrix australiensis]|uniref:Pyochelin biosynthetic protein PchC n=1 Tax=Saccharothrix australiensis TaxID=2072 RepID=A0A495W0J4_9PSEU|nr:alpha/beta fold hydrolase [Saccharothrix australiensis]RKT54273.1 pyochelin biosynthetic protein PchC [Saccharothrix australiensis]